MRRALNSVLRRSQQPSQLQYLQFSLFVFFKMFTSHLSHFYWEINTYLHGRLIKRGTASSPMSTFSYCTLLWAPFTITHPLSLCAHRAKHSHVNIPPSVYFLYFWWSLPQRISITLLYSLIIDLCSLSQLYLTWK